MTISQIYTTAPSSREGVEQAAFDLLEQLAIPYTRVEHESADTMEDCRAISETLGVSICKNLVLCNRQQTQFYLLCMPADKPFKTKDLSAQINSSRLSFASGEKMVELLGVTPGSASILSLMNDKEHAVQLLLDRELCDQPYFGCHPCKNTGSLKLATFDVLNTFLPHVQHTAIIVDLPNYEVNA